MMDVPRHLLTVKSSSTNKPTGATEPSGRNIVTAPSEQSITIDTTSPLSQFSSRTNEEVDRLSEAKEIARKPAPKRALPPRPRKQPPKKTAQSRGLRIDSWATFPTPACFRGIHPPTVPLKGAVASIEKPTYKHVFTHAATERAYKIHKSQTEPPSVKGSMALLEKPAPKHLFIIAAAEGYSNGNGSTEHSRWRK